MKITININPLKNNSIPTEKVHIYFKIRVINKHNPDQKVTKLYKL